MADLPTDFLGTLVKAKGDLHALSALAAAFVLASRPEAERLQLRAALDVAAVLRWFDKKLLAKMLDLTVDEAPKLFNKLKVLPFVERYRQGALDLLNVHESTRLGWRKQLAREHPRRFARISAKAAGCFVGDLTTVGRIDRIYHLLCADPKHGAKELNSLNREWSSWAHHEERFALASTLRELDDTLLVHGIARVEVLLVTAWARVPRKLVKNQAVYGENLAIYRAVAEEDPRNPGCQRDLASTLSKVGAVLQAQGKLRKALMAYSEDLSIRRRLTGEDPGNAGWQRDLALTYSKLGDVLQEQRNLADAEAAFRESLAIIGRLTKKDHGNAGWQMDFAIAHSKLGDVLQAQRKFDDSQAAFEESLAILGRLARQDPSNARWQRDWAMAFSKVGGVLQAQDRLPEAQAAFQESLAIIERSGKQNPSNARWQRDWAIVHGKAGELLQGRFGTGTNDGQTDGLFDSAETKQSELEDMEIVAAQERAVYSANDAVPEVILREWYIRNRSGFNMVLCGDKKVGHLNLLPFKQEFLTKLIEGKAVEKDAKASDIYPQASRRSIKDLYVESFAILHPVKNLRGRILVHVLSQFANIISRVCPPSQIRYVYALAATEDGKNLLSGLHFSEVTTRHPRKDALSFFYVLYADLVPVLSKFLEKTRPLNKAVTNVLLSGL